MLIDAKRVVIKIGSRVLVQSTGRPDTRRMRALVSQVAKLRKEGCEVILVSSGAVGAGMQALGMKRRPATLPDLQMAAAVGQSRLMGTYTELFSKYGVKLGQVLLTHGDLNDRVRHLNARNTIVNLIEHGIVPVVNENDVIAVDEIKFGDNDQLASLVSVMMEADALVLLTTVDGFRIPTAGGRTKRASVLDGLDEKTKAYATGKGSHISTGGMESKLQSAEIALSTGIPVVIANGRAAGVIQKIMSGGDVGTFIHPAKLESIGGIPLRKKWIAFFHKTQGTIIVDEGAAVALSDKGRSLLAAGIRNVEGEFGPGAMVSIQTKGGKRIARGLTSYSSQDIKKIKGCKTSEIKALLGARDYDEVVHRDNMVIMG